MPRLCKLTESATREPIYINPIQVRFIRSADDGTQIVFDDEHYLGVIESVDVVRQAIDDAIRA